MKLKYDYSPETTTQTLLLTTATKTIHMKRGQWSSSQTKSTVKNKRKFLVIVVNKTILMVPQCSQDY